MPLASFECSRCGASFREADLDFRAQAATCRFCGAVTPLPAVPEAAGGPVPVVTVQAPAAQVAAVRPKVPRPDSIVHIDLADGIRLVYRWFSPLYFFLLFFCAAWDGFLVFWYWMGLGGNGPPGPMRFIFLFFPIAHVAVGVGLTYFTIAGFLNRTRIDVTRDELRVRHGPVPWKGNTTIAAASLDQLYCSVGKSSSNQSGQMQYVVSAILKDGRRIKLISMLHADEEAWYIERTIEDFLGLAHHPVTGELVT